MTISTTTAYRTRYHRDHTVTIWDVYSQSYIRTSRPSSAILASLSAEERSRVQRHVARASLVEVVS